MMVSDMTVSDCPNASSLEWPTHFAGPAARARVW